MPKLSTQIADLKLAQSNTSRKQLIQIMKQVIRKRHKLQRQISRKYEGYQSLEKYLEHLRGRIQQLSIKTI